MARRKKVKSNVDRALDWLGERIDLEELVSWFSLSSLIYEPLDRRLNVRDAFRKMLNRPIPSHFTVFHYFGSAIFILFCIQVITGTLLAFYYRPTPEAAHESVEFIMNRVYLGWLIREIHAWSANLMIFLLFLHMARVYFARAFNPPRELNWMVGVVLFLVTLGFGFTGYLLPWSQSAFWATRVGTEVFGWLPVFGDKLMILFRGGEDVTGNTLIRFYVFHVIILPWVMTALLWLHFAIVRRQGLKKKDEDVAPVAPEAVAVG
jgi:quinol-cytochrome oxidoreductase complex cytochrome b subunit